MKKPPTFPEHVLSRAEAGRREYGDRSFGRPLTDLLVEITEELADVAAWSHIAQVSALRAGHNQQVAPALHRMLYEGSVHAWRLHDVMTRLQTADFPKAKTYPGVPLREFLVNVALMAAELRAPRCLACESDDHCVVCLGTRRITCRGAALLYTNSLGAKP